MKKQRLLAIDVVRGFAMVLVILQHAYLLADYTLIPSWLNFLVWNTTGIAAVAFVSVSGVVCSYYLSTASDWRTAYKKYAMRALFLLLVAHPIINTVVYPFKVLGVDAVESSWYFFWHRFFLGFPITDTIALCILLAPLIIIRFSSLWRAILVVTILFVSPLVLSLYSPASPELTVIKEGLFGKLGEPKMFWFPLLPWLAVFLSGSFVGVRLASFVQGRVKSGYLVWQFRKTGFFLLLCSVVLIIGYKLLKANFYGPIGLDLFRAIAPSQVTGVLPVYLAFLVWVLAALISLIDVTGCYNRFFWFLSVFGRASLFTFIIQFVVVESIPAMLGFKGVLDVTGYFVLFVVGTLVTWLVTYYYGRARNWFPVNDYEQVRQGCRAGRDASV